MHVALTLFVITLSACGGHQNATTTTPTAPAPAGPAVILPDGFAIHVEIAADDPTREQGLMFRDQLAPDRGMIFFFPSVGVYPFWMKNTLIPLDMVWIDDAKRVVYVARNVPPCKADPCPSYSPNANARYVLEIAAGGAARHNVVTGSVLQFQGLDKIVVR